MRQPPEMLTNAEIKENVDTVLKSFIKGIKLNAGDEEVVRAGAALITSMLIALHTIAEASEEAVR